VLNVDRKREGAAIKFTEQAQIDPGKLTLFVARTKGDQFSPGAWWGWGVEVQFDFDTAGGRRR
jgi:hypothetical protein